MFYCSKHRENVDREDCYECEENGDCQQFENMEKTQEKLDLIRATDFHKRVKETLKAIFNLGDEELNKLADNMFSNAVSTGENLIRSCLNNMIEMKAVQYIDTKMGERLDSIFEETLKQEVLVISKDDKVLRATIEDKVLSRMKDFFGEKSRYSQGKMDDVIEKLVEKKVDETIKELKRETIEKFNKEMMKKMMSGMAKAIGDDKRLLSIL